MAMTVCAATVRAPKARTKGLLRHTHDARGRTMVGNIGLGVAGAPIVVIRLARLKQRRVALIAIAETPAAGALAAAVIIGDDIVLAVRGIVAGADPGDRGHVRAGRACRLRSAAAAAKKPVDGAVAPVLAGQGVARIRF